MSYSTKRFFHSYTVPCVLTKFSKLLMLFEMAAGKSFSEALILASVNPQYEKRLFIEFPEKIQVHNMLCTKNVFCFCFDI